MSGSTLDGFTGGPAAWYRSTGQTALSLDGSIAYEYIDPFRPMSPVWAPVIGTPVTIASPPQALYLYESFLWIYPQHGPVVWDVNPSPVVVIPSDPTPVAHAPEPAAQALLILGLLLMCVLATVQRFRRERAAL